MDDFKFQWTNNNDINNVGNSRRPYNSIAFVRRLTIITPQEEDGGGDDGSCSSVLATGNIELIPAEQAVTDSELRITPYSKTPLVTYATIAYHIQNRSPLDRKQRWFYGVCDELKNAADTTGGTTKIHVLVNRETVLQDSVKSVLSLSPNQLRQPWKIEFIDEPALDYGGVMRGTCIKTLCCD
jgi:hypothetical protein